MLGSENVSIWDFCNTFFQEYHTDTFINHFGPFEDIPQTNQQVIYYPPDATDPETTVPAAAAPAAVGPAAVAPAAAAPAAAAPAGAAPAAGASAAAAPAAAAPTKTGRSYA